MLETKRVVHTNLFIGGVGDGKRIEFDPKIMGLGVTKLPYVDPASTAEKVDSVSYSHEEYTIRTMMSDTSLLTFWVKHDWSTEKALRRLFQSYEEFSEKKRG